MDTDEANRHRQSILSRVSQQPQLNELTSRTVEISSSRAPEDSAEETLEESDMDTTVLDNDRSSERFLGVIRQDQELKTLSEDGGGDLQRSLA